MSPPFLTSPLENIWLREKVSQVFSIEQPQQKILSYQAIRYTVLPSNRLPQYLFTTFKYPISNNIHFRVRGSSTTSFHKKVSDRAYKKTLLLYTSNGYYLYIQYHFHGIYLLYFAIVIFTQSDFVNCSIFNNLQTIFMSYLIIIQWVFTTLLILTTFYCYF